MFICLSPFRGIGENIHTNRFLNTEHSLVRFLSFTREPCVLSVLQRKASQVCQDGPGSRPHSPEPFFFFFFNRLKNV